MVFCWLFLSCNFCLRKLASPGGREAHVIVIANLYNTSPDLIFFRQFYSAIYVVGVVGKKFLNPLYSKHPLGWETNFELLVFPT